MTFVFNWLCINNNLNTKQYKTCEGLDSTLTVLVRSRTDTQPDLANPIRHV